MAVRAVSQLGLTALETATRYVKRTSCQPKKLCAAAEGELSTAVSLEIYRLEMCLLNLPVRVPLCRVLSGADYNLVLGMPGAGKTSTVVAAVAALAAAGRSVLLTSYTNRCRRLWAQI